MYLFSLASQHSEWLAARQAVTAANIANADTPGYKARDVAAFDSVLHHTQLGLAVTSAGHMDLTGSGLKQADQTRGESWDTAVSGNSVTLEAELIKLGEASRQNALDQGLTKIFHRMILTSLKV